MGVYKKIGNAGMPPLRQAAIPLIASGRHHSVVKWEIEKQKYDNKSLSAKEADVKLKRNAEPN